MPADAVESNNGIKADPSTPAVPFHSLFKGASLRKPFHFYGKSQFAHSDEQVKKKHGIRNVPKKLNHLDFLEEAQIVFFFSGIGL